jgi:hypothetical protein
MRGLLRLGALCACLATIVTVAVGPATADSQGEGAVVINGAGCFVGRPYFGLIFTTNSHITLTPSGNGSTECHFQDVPNPTGETIVEQGFPCSVAGQETTTNSTLVFTTSGNVEIICTYNGNGA